MRGPKLMFLFVFIPHFSFSVAEIASFTEQLLNNLFNALALPGSSENEYIMKGASSFFFCVNLWDTFVVHIIVFFIFICRLTLVLI